MSDERALLQAVLERPEDDVRRLVYADWLEEHGDDARAEFLRLTVQTRREWVVTPEQRRRHDEVSAGLARLFDEMKAAAEAATPPPQAHEWPRLLQELDAELELLSQRVRPGVPARLQELAASLDPNWLGAVSAPGVEACGKSDGGQAEWAPVRFRFVCDRSWAEMQPTDDPAVRHCAACDRGVHFCDNLADARTHARQGHCIALDLGIRRREGDLQPNYFAGMASEETYRRAEEENLDPVSRARLDARRDG